MTPLPHLIESDRLLLRPSDPAYAEAVNAAIRESFPDLHRWLPWADHLPDVEETRDRLRLQHEKFLAGSDHSFGIWLRATGEYVGGVGLHPRPADPDRREIGYWIHSHHARKGIAGEAVRAVADAAFAALKLAAIQIRMSERNAASRRVAERAGFVQEAIVEDGRVDRDGTPSRTLFFVCRRPHDRQPTLPVGATT